MRALEIINKKNVLYIRLSKYNSLPLGMGRCLRFFFRGKTNDDCRCKRRTKFEPLFFADFDKSLKLRCDATRIYIKVQYRKLICARGYLTLTKDKQKKKNGNFFYQ